MPELADNQPTKPDPIANLIAEEEAERAEQAAMAEAARGGEEPQAAEQPGEAQAAPWEADGFKTPDAVYQSYQELQRKFRERDGEIGELRKFREQAEPVINQYQQQQYQQPAGQQPQLPDGTPIFEFAYLQQMVDDGQLSEFQANGIWAEQQAKVTAATLTSHVEQMMAERLGPLQAAHVDRGARDTLDQLNASLGDDVVARNSEMIADLITADRAHYADPKHGARRLREAVISAEWDRQNGTGTRQQPRNDAGQFAPADTYIEGGSSAQPPPAAGGTRLDPEEQALVQSLSWQRPVDEKGIPLPR